MHFGHFIQNQKSIFMIKTIGSYRREGAFRTFEVLCNHPHLRWILGGWYTTRYFYVEKYLKNQNKLHEFFNKVVKQSNAINALSDLVSEQEKSKCIKLKVPSKLRKSTWTSRSCCRWFGNLPTHLLIAESRVLWTFDCWILRANRLYRKSKTTYLAQTKICISWRKLV